MKKLIFVILFLMFSLSVAAQIDTTGWNEADYQQYFADTRFPGVYELEYTVDGSRVDIVTPVWTLEVGFSGHGEDFYQALRYAMILNQNLETDGKKPGIVWIRSGFILESTYDRHLNNLIETIHAWIPGQCSVWTVDEQGEIRRRYAAGGPCNLIYDPVARVYYTAPETLEF